MNKIKEFFLENYIKIILLTLCYLFYNEYYNILIYLFLLYVISLVGFWIFAIFRLYKLKELITKLKTVLTGSFLLKFFLIFLTIGFIFKSIYSTYPILFYGENKEKMINAIVGDNSKINVRSDGSTFRSFNDNNNGIKFIFTLPYSSTVSDTIFTIKTKEETINVLKEKFSDKQISKLQDYDIYFKFQYYNQKDYLVKEINIDPNEDF